MLRMCREWSLQDHTLLRSSRTEALNGQFGLRLRTAGYSWFCQHKQDRNFIKIIRIGEYKTLLKDVDALWVVPSSNTKEDNFKIFAKKRFALRQDPSVATTLEEFVRTRSSCWIIEEKGGQYYCDCFSGIKGKLCKHSVGLMYKTKILTETEDVRSKPLGQKRKPGRPKKLPHCLTSSPAPALPSPAVPTEAAAPVPTEAVAPVPAEAATPVPVSRYWSSLSPEEPATSRLSPTLSSPSPELRGHNVSVVASLSPALPAAMRKSRKRRREKSPPVQRKKVVLSFVEDENLMKSISKKRTSRRRNKIV